MPAIAMDASVTMGKIVGTIRDAIVSDRVVVNKSTGHPLDAS